MLSVKPFGFLNLILVVQLLHFSFIHAAALPDNQTDDTSELVKQQFSYIVAGGGTAGLVLAARLSEDPDKTVLVLEAGDPHLDESVILTPAEVGSVFGDPSYDWMHQTIPQRFANNAILDITRGKLLGGTSAINAMIWDRSSKQEYDLISQLGNPGWDWDNLLPYFKKPEKFTPPDSQFAEQWNLTFDPTTRGFSGPINTAFPVYIPDAELPVEPAGLSLGLDLISEPMGGRTMGIWRSESSVDPQTRTRAYSANAYFVPNRLRPNLKVLTGAHVTRIEWAPPSPNSGNLTATGVEFLFNGTTYSAMASREVILSAGSIGSPQILELSGVGGPVALRDAGVSPTLNLTGVGENMQEHIYVSLSYKLKPGVASLDQLFSNTTYMEEQRKLYEEVPASGAFTYTASGVTFLNLRDFIPSESQSLISNLQSQLSQTSRTSGQIAQQSLQLELISSPNSSVIEVFTEGVHISADTADPNSSYVSFLVLLQQPFSRGSTHISSSNATDHPIIDPDYFHIDFDLELLVEAAQFVRSTLSKTQAWASVIESEDFPGPSVSNSDDWETWVKSTIKSQGHTTGTCSMQPREQGGVVDANLKIYGTTNVRVVDLSVMPLQFSGHPQALVYALAEKGADLIKGANF